MKMPKLATQLLLLSAVFGALTASLSAQTKNFMKIPGIDGSSMFEPGSGLNYDGWMEVEGFRFGNYRTGGIGSSVSPPSASSVSVYMNIDPKAFGALFIASLNGAIIGTAAKDGDFLIENATLSPIPRKHVQVSLRGRIQSLEIEGSAGDRMFVNLEITVEKIRINAYHLNDLGASVSTEGSWDFKDNKAL